MASVERKDEDVLRDNPPPPGAIVEPLAELPAPRDDDEAE